MRRTLFRLALAFAAACPLPLAAQDAPSSPPPLRIFLDCPEWRCDPDFFRTEFPFADFARDPQDADVHILVTEVETGGGGSEFTVTTLGRKRFDGQADTLRAYTTADATDDDERKAIAQRLGLSLARYVAYGPRADRFTLRYSAPESERAAATQAVRDPWNYWAFRTSASAYLNGEQSYRSRDFSGSVRAARITADLKVEIEAYGSTSRSEYEVDDSTTIIGEQEGYGASALFAPTLGAHWGWASYVSAERSSYSNEALELEVLSGVEYDIWPYAEVTRRLLTIRAYGGIRHYRYDEETLYGEMSETRPVGALETSLSVTQPWGSIGASLDGSMYFHDLRKYRAELSGEMDIRLFRGLSLNVWGEIASIHDQLSLPAGDATDEEILLRRRQLATDYTYYTSIGLSYNFGSKFNNVVNPRFR
jgi:hypothetical protein